MDSKFKFTSSTNAHQRGQAMVEYAILLILMVTLVMGGLELSITAYHSKKTGDAAEAGANSWAEAISFSKANPTDPTQQSTEEFEQLIEREREALNIDTLHFEDYDFSYEDNDEDGVVTYHDDRHCGSLPIPLTDPPSEPCTLNRDSAGHDIADIDLVITDRDEIRPFLPLGCQIINTPLPTLTFNIDVKYINQFNPDLPIDITACDQTQAGFEDNIRLLLSDANNEIDFELFPLADNRELDPYQDFIEICTSRANPDAIEKIVACRHLVDNDRDILNTDTSTPADGIQDVCIPALVPPTTDCADGILDGSGVKDGIDDNDPTFRRLLVLKELKNSDAFNRATSSSSPVQRGVIERRGLGDHNPTRVDTVNDGISNQFRRPSCNANVEGNVIPYDNGLPQDGRIYLFNPLPIDITNCNGADATRNNTSRASILVGGFINNNNPALNIEGLPALNQAVYSEYVKVCVVENAGQISIARNGSAVVGLDDCVNLGNSIWLKPPGKMCGAAGGTEVCPDLDDVEGDGDLVISNLQGATGFYYFGRTNDAVNRTLTPTLIYRTFRPAFQIVCGDFNNNGQLSTETDPERVDDDNDPTTGDCAESGTGSFALEVHTRYRSIFESFLTFGFNQLNNANLAQYFYNPNGVGTSGAVVGAVGSELGPVNNINDQIPSLKKIKDFRGCFRVDISPPDRIGDQVKTAVSSCN